MRAVNEAKLEHLTACPVVMKQLEQTWRSETRKRHWNTMDIEPSANRLNTRKKSDPVLAGLREDEKLISKPTPTMSSRYRRNFKFIN